MERLPLRCEEGDKRQKIQLNLKEEEGMPRKCMPSRFLFSEGNTRLFYGGQYKLLAIKGSRAEKSLKVWNRYNGE